MTSSFKIVFRTVLLFISIALTVGFSACNDENFSTNSKYKISFSTDTLTFDTVFTTLGSATSKIWVFNRNNVALKISHLGIGGGKNSPFRINVDGSVNADNQFSNIEIGAHDSIFIFVALTVNPTNSNSPVFIQDSILFETNGVNQNVKLEAFGQDMIVMRDKYILNDTTLNADKPYLVYGNLAIDTAKTLTLQPGTRIYFHNNANLIIYGNLIAEGTAENPILLRGDRLDKIKFVTPVPYNVVAGQWGGVYLLWNGGNHVLKHVNMNSGYVGLYYVNDNRKVLPNLLINDCRIHNFQLYGLVVQNGNVTVSNSEISNTSSYSVYLNGGKHTFIQSTIANYFNSSPNTVSRDKKPAVMIMDLNRIAPMETIFRNCVISGSSENEFSLASKFLNEYKGTFDHCYIRKPEASKLPQFTNIHWYERNDTVFKSTNYDAEKGIYFNFALDSVSPARGLADPTLFTDPKYINFHLEKDLNGNNRFEDCQPDAGAYEWESTKKQ
jgi:hypothetical protein